MGQDGLGEKLPYLEWRKMAPEVGFEPTTNRLTADRSTAATDTILIGVHAWRR